MRVGIIGAGIAGLVAGYELSKAGVHVTVLEREQRIGGLASSFTVETDLEIERYYHFICKPDRAYLDMIRELGLASRLHWVTTKMGLFYNGGMYTIGDLPNLLAFPYLSVGDKLRFACSTAMVKFSTGTSWKRLENVQAEQWLVQQYGRRSYNLLYAPLLNLKFRAHASRVSAAWMWARFHRLGNSRNIVQQERLGYLEGGTQIYVAALEKAMRQQGVDLHTGATAERLLVEGGRVTGVQSNGEQLSFECVLSTTPVPRLLELVADVNCSYFGKLRTLDYIDVLVMVLLLRHSFSPYFWMNVSDRQIDLPGIIEYTNLNPCPQLGGRAILYVPQYLPSTHSLHVTPEEDLFRLYCEYLHRINPSFCPDWVQGYWVHRDRFAQPICAAVRWLLQGRRRWDSS